MKLNKYANQSHVLVEGFNEYSRKWYQIEQCPSGIKGRIQWQQFSCIIKIPENTTKIRPVLNAGWSSEPKVARTWFDEVILRKLANETQHENLEIKKLILPEIMDNKSSPAKLATLTKILEYEKINPTHWNLRISASTPSTIAFAEPYDQTWEATVFKDGKKVDVAKSMPLYGVINAFQIRETGNLDIVLRYLPQYWYEVGLMISALSFAACIFYIIYDWRRNKEIKHSSWPSSGSNKI
jgi:hypothetical protein